MIDKLRNRDTREGLYSLAYTTTIALLSFVIFLLTQLIPKGAEIKVFEVQSKIMANIGWKGIWGVLDAIPEIKTFVIILSLALILVLIIYVLFIISNITHISYDGMRLDSVYQKMILVLSMSLLIGFFHQLLIKDLTINLFQYGSEFVEKLEEISYDNYDDYYDE